MKKTLSLMLMLALLTIIAIPAVGAAAPKVSITWMHHFAEEGMVGWVQKLADEFMTMYPECEVLVEAVPGSSYDQTLKTRIANEDAPMIFDMMNGRTGLAEFYNAGHLALLDEMECLDRIVEDVLIEGQLDGHQAGIPWDQLSYAAFYNVDLFNELGLTVPTTLDEFYAVLNTLKDNGYIALTSPYGESWCIACAMYPILYSEVDTDANPNWWTQLMNREIRFSDDEDFKAAMKEFITLLDYAEDDPFGTSSATAYYNLANGKAGIFINGSWVLDGASSLNPDINLGCFAVPTDNSGEPRMMMASGTISCLYNSPDPLKMEYGRKLYNYIYSTASGEYYASIAKRITGVKGVDLTAYPNLNEILTYPRTFSLAGKNQFSAEFSTYYIECVSAALQDYMDSRDVDAAVESLVASLDDGFDDIAGI